MSALTDAMALADELAAETIPDDEWIGFALTCKKRDLIVAALRRTEPKGGVRDAREALIARSDKYLNTGSGEYASEIMRDMAEFIRRLPLKPGEREMEREYDPGMNPIDDAEFEMKP